MNTLRVFGGIFLIIIVAGAYVFALLRTRVSGPAPTEVQDSEISSAITGGEFLAKLRSRDVNGQLPVVVSQDEASQPDRNPFAAP